jgi:transcriptional regulator with XRE-family HTH domain
MQTGHYLRPWRKYRGLTLAQVADAIDLHLSVLAKIEAGKTAYTQPRLEALARLYRCHVSDLLNPPPSPETALPALLMAIKRLSDDEQQRALAVLRAAFDKLSKAA